MKNYRKSSHTVYDLKYHVVFCTKYRKPVLIGEKAERCRELIRQISEKNNVKIVSGHISKDHIHLLISIPPSLSVSKLMNYMKGMTSRKLMQEYKDLKKIYWGQRFWSPGYFAVTVGNMTEQMIADYIAHQDEHHASGDDNFEISTL